LRATIDALEQGKFDWNDRYLATMQPGHRVEVIMAGIARSGKHFMARTDSEILIGNTSDLPDPRPARGDRFTFAASEYT
jgi:cell filamentation protein